MSDDPLAFLKACVDEDERVAKAAGGDAWRANDSGVYHEDDRNQPGPFAVGPYDYLDDAEAAHIALHDPARELREVAFKRAILEAWRDNEAERGESASYTDGLADGLALAIHYLLAVYSDRPGFKPEWAS